MKVRILRDAPDDRTHSTCGLPHLLAEQLRKAYCSFDTEIISKTIHENKVKNKQQFHSLHNRWQISLVYLKQT